MAKKLPVESHLPSQTSGHATIGSEFSLRTTNAKEYNLILGFMAGADIPSETIQKHVAQVCAKNVDPHLFQYATLKPTVEFSKSLGNFFGSSFNTEKSGLTFGNSHGLTLVARTLMSITKHERNTVLLESPTYFLAAGIFSELGLNVRAIDTDSDGLIPEKLEEYLKTYKDDKTKHPLFVYVNPVYRNPSGASMPETRRVKLLALAEKYDFCIVSDEPYNLIKLEESSYSDSFIETHRKTNSSFSNLVCLFTFAKILAPGIRLGWFTCSGQALRDKLLMDAASRSSGGPSPMLTEAVRGLIDSGDLKANIVRLQRVLKAKRDALLRELCDQFGKDKCTYTTPNGGYFVWVKFAGIPDSAKFKAFLMDTKNTAEGTASGQQDMKSGEQDTRSGFPIHVLEGAQCLAVPSKEPNPWIRLSFTVYSPEEYHEIVRCMKRAYDRFVAGK